MIPVYPWPFHPEYYRRREIVEDRLRRLKALGKPVWPDSDAPTACHSLGQAIRANPFPQSFSDPGHLNISGRDDIGADVIMDGLPEDSPPLVGATREWYASINARTLQARIPNSWAADYAYEPWSTITYAPTGHFSPQEKIITARYNWSSTSFFTEPPYFNFRGYVFDELSYYVAGRNSQIGSVGQLGGFIGHVYSRWVGLRLDGTMESAGPASASGHKLSPSITGAYFIHAGSDTPEFYAYAASHGKTVRTYTGSILDAADTSANIEPYAYSIATLDDGTGWISISDQLRCGLDKWQFHSADQYFFPSPLMDGAVIYDGGGLWTNGHKHVLTEDGTLYRYDGTSMSVRATGVYLFSTNPARIYFDNGTEEDL